MEFVRVWQWWHLYWHLSSSKYFSFMLSMIKPNRNWLETQVNNLLAKVTYSVRKKWPLFSKTYCNVLLMKRWSDKNWNLASCQKLRVNQKFIKHYWVKNNPIIDPSNHFRWSTLLRLFYCWDISIQGFRALKLPPLSLILSLFFFNGIKLKMKFTQ